MQNFLTHFFQKKLLLFVFLNSLALSISAQKKQRFLDSLDLDAVPKSINREGDRREKIYQILQLPDGSLLALGTSQAADQAAAGFLLRVNANNGSQIFRENFTLASQFTAAAPLPDGSLLAVGSSQNVAVAVLFSKKMEVVASFQTPELPRWDAAQALPAGRVILAHLAKTGELTTAIFENEKLENHRPSQKTQLQKLKNTQLTADEQGIWLLGTARDGKAIAACQLDRTGKLIPEKKYASPNHKNARLDLQAVARRTDGSFVLVGGKHYDGCSPFCLTLSPKGDWQSSSNMPDAWNSENSWATAAVCTHDGKVIFSRHSASGDTRELVEKRDNFPSRNFSAPAETAALFENLQGNLVAVEQPSGGAQLLNFFIFKRKKNVLLAEAFKIRCSLPQISTSKGGFHFTADERGSLTFDIENLDSTNSRQLYFFGKLSGTARTNGWQILQDTQALLLAPRSRRQVRLLLEAGSQPMSTDSLEWLLSNGQQAIFSRKMAAPLGFQFIEPAQFSSRDTLEWMGQWFGFEVKISSRQHQTVEKMRAGLRFWLNQKQIPIPDGAVQTADSVWLSGGQTCFSYRLRWAAEDLVLSPMPSNSIFQFKIELDGQPLVQKTLRLVPRKPVLYLLAIGVNDAEQDGLQFAEADASDFAAAVQRLGCADGCLFDSVVVVACLRSPSEVAVREVLEQWHGRLAARRYAQPEQDYLMAFFSGHGEVDGLGKTFLVLGDGSRLPFEDFFLKKIDSTAGKKFFFVDACRDFKPNIINVVSKSAVPDHRLQDALKNAILSQRGVMTFFSCKTGEKSKEIRDRQHGAFTLTLLQILSKPPKNGWLSARSLQKRLSEGVQDLLKNEEQTPELVKSPLDLNEDVPVFYFKK